MKKRQPRSRGAAPVQPDPRPEYDVGYGKPPKYKQYLPGQSGNPNGRPKVDPLDVRRILAGILEEKVAVTENGRRQYLTKIEIAATQIANHAAKGDKSVFKYFVALMQLTYGKDLPPPKPNVALIIER